MGFDLDKYLSEGIEILVKDIIKATLRNPKASLFITRFAAASKRAAKIRMQEAKRGRHIPPFIIASIASKCNLHCAGCYSRANNACFDSETESELSVGDWQRIFKEAKRLGITFILLAGGEPLTRMDVIKAAGKIKDILFPIFTNGTMIDADFIALLAESPNLVPILSIEGSEAKTDLLRGRGVHEKLMQAMCELKSNGLIFGASITVRKANLLDVTSQAFMDSLVNKGCKVVFYVEYVPFEVSSESQAPDEYDRELLAKKLTELRSRYTDTIFISFPGDEAESGGCLAAGRGFFHISSTGSAEPCPFSPYSDTNLKNVSLKEAVNSPLFKKLRETNVLIAEHTGGCVLFDKADTVKEILNQTTV